MDTCLCIYANARQDELKIQWLLATHCLLGETRGINFHRLKWFSKAYSHIIPYQNFLVSPPNIQEILKVALKQGCANKASICSTDKMSDSMINPAVFLVIYWCPEGEMATEY